MTEYIIVPKVDFDQMANKIDSEKNDSEEKNVTEQRGIVEQKNISEETKNLLLENFRKRESYDDKNFDEENLDIKILSNTLPKNVRIEGESLLRKLIKENKIVLENHDEIKNLKSTRQPKINGEDLLRCIFIPNSSIKKHVNFFEGLLDFIPNDIIKNKKLIRLKRENDHESDQSGDEYNQNPIFTSWEILTGK